MQKKLIVLLAIVSSALLSAPAKVKAENADPIASGKALYATNCVTCHGEKYDGQGPAGKYLTPKPRNLAVEKLKNGETKEAIASTIKNGLDGTQMVAFGKPKGALSETECNDLAAFVFSLRKH